MHQLLERLLKKRKIESIVELDKDEVRDFDRWQRILIAKEIDLENLKDFIKEQKGKAEQEIANPDNTKERDMFLKASLNIYRSLLELIESPRAEKETLEKFLNQLLEE